MSTRERHIATYNYPGSFFPESTTREIPEPTFAAAAAAGPDEDGYFHKDGWYSVLIETELEEQFTSTDTPAKTVWVSVGRRRKVGHWVVGERIHWSEIEATERNSILIDNIKCNSRDGGYGVLTRAGNWQIASDYTDVVSAAEVAA